MSRKIQAAILAMIVVVCVLGAYRPWEQTIQTMGEADRYSVSFFDVFDTQTELIGYGTNQQEFEAQAAQIKEKLLYYHKLYDIYHDYEGIHNLKTINDNAGIAPVKVDREIINLLKLGQEMYELTNGQINIAMGSVLSIWHDYRQQGSLNPEKASIPGMEELEKAAVHTDIQQIIIDEEASTVFLQDKEMSLDVGSIGKGYAVQKTAEYAREIGVENLLFSVGGNICTIGTRRDDTKWRVGIQNPDLTSEESYVKKVELENQSLVTSGNYQRYYTVDGQRYCHIIDTDTLMPADEFPSVSILMNDSGKADAISTAVFNMSVEEGMAFVNALDGVEAMWVLGDGSILYSDNFEQYVIE